MSESEEMYLITIARLGEKGSQGLVPLSKLAESLSVVPVSVNQMVKKLEEAGLVHYIPYKGVELTEQGRQVARQVLRHRRLWEYFFVEHLELPIPEADTLACRLEHVTSNKLANRLYAYLGQPKVSPQGKPILAAEELLDQDFSQTLAQLQVGQESEVVRVEAGEAVTDFLRAEGIEPGAEVCVLAKGTDGSILISSKDKETNMSNAIASQVFIKEFHRHR